jgi:hypothetical protein
VASLANYPLSFGVGRPGSGAASSDAHSVSRPHPRPHLRLWRQFFLNIGAILGACQVSRARAVIVQRPEGRYGQLVLSHFPPESFCNGFSWSGKQRDMCRSGARSGKSPRTRSLSDRCCRIPEVLSPETSASRRSPARGRRPRRVLRLFAPSAPRSTLAGFKVAEMRVQLKPVWILQRSLLHHRWNRDFVQGVIRCERLTVVDHTTLEVAIFSGFSRSFRRSFDYPRGWTPDCMFVIRCLEIVYFCASNVYVSTSGV